MDFVDNGKTVTVDGVVFAKLSPNDRRKLMAPEKARRRVNLKENLKEGGVTGEAYLNEMDAFDQLVFGDKEFFDYMTSVEGRAELLALACQKANPDPATAAALLDGLTLGIDDDFTLAAKLAGVRITTATAEPTTETESRPSGAGS